METTIKNLIKAGRLILVGWLVGLALASCIASSQAAVLQSDKPRLAPNASQVISMRWLAGITISLSTSTRL